MTQRRFHYEQAFEYYLRAKKIPYVAVDEAKKAIHAGGSLKSFDFVVYGSRNENFLVDVKGRKHSGRTRKQLDNWVTTRDIEDLGKWEKVFGNGFKSVLVFLYWCEAQPPDALFLETFCFKDRWYAVRAAFVDEYHSHMSKRSEKWNTVHVPAASFAKISRPLMDLL